MSPFYMFPTASNTQFLDIKALVLNRIPDSTLPGNPVYSSRPRHPVQHLEMACKDKKTMAGVCHTVCDPLARPGSSMN